MIIHSFIRTELKLLYLNTSFYADRTTLNTAITHIKTFVTHTWMHTHSLSHTDTLTHKHTHTDSTLEQVASSVL